MSRASRALTADEREGIILAVRSAFAKLRKLYNEILPIFDNYGFKPPSAGVVARDLSEKIETSIVQHCESFSKGKGHADLSRDGQAWEVKICKDSGLTINQSKQVAGENYIVVNYRADSQVNRVWVLWEAEDRFFSPRLPKSNARSMLRSAAESSVELLFDAATTTRARMAKAEIAERPRAKSRA